MVLCFELAERSVSDKAEITDLQNPRGAQALRNLHSVVNDGWSNGFVWTRDTLGGLFQPQANAHSAYQICCIVKAPFLAFLA